MSRFHRILMSVLLAFFTSQASAGLIFNFEIDELSPININGQLSDKFSIAFDNSADLATGVSSSDILWISYNSSHLGYHQVSNFSTNYNTSELEQFFTFTELANNLWQLDILVGLTGNNGIISLQKNGYGLQFGQTDDGSGATSLMMFSPSDIVLAHEFATSRVFSAQATIIPEPSAIALILLGVLAVARFNHRQVRK